MTGWPPSELGMRFGVGGHIPSSPPAYGGVGLANGDSGRIEPEVERPAFIQHNLEKDCWMNLQHFLDLKQHFLLKMEIQVVHNQGQQHLLHRLILLVHHLVHSCQANRLYYQNHHLLK